MSYHPYYGYPYYQYHQYPYDGYPLYAYPGHTYNDSELYYAIDHSGNILGPPEPLPPAVLQHYSRPYIHYDHRSNATTYGSPVPSARGNVMPYVPVHYPPPVHYLPPAPVAVVTPVPVPAPASAVPTLPPIKRIVMNCIFFTNVFKTFLFLSSHWLQAEVFHRVLLNFLDMLSLI